MRFVFGCAATAAAILFCSCDKHHVGELPEVQKEHVDLASKSEQSTAQPNERSTSSSANNEKSPTPAEFFSPKKSP